MLSLNKSLTSGILYTAIAKYSNIIFSIIISAILARLLTPKEFGIVALVMVFVTFVNLLGEFGIGKAVVQNQKLTNHDIRSIFSFSIIFAFFFSGLFFLTAPVISKFYNEPELIIITKYLSLSAFFNILQTIPRALLEKALEFKKIGFITVITQLLTGVIAVILAYHDLSYYALIIREILNGFIIFIIFLYMAPIKIVLNLDFYSVNKIIKFSFYNFSFNFINYFTRNGDNLLVGKYLGSITLGFYDKAYRLMMMPVQNLTHVITPVMMPVFVKYQNNNTLIYNNYLRIIKILATIGFPLSIFLYFSAYEIINIMYGSQWNASIPVFKILALIIGIQMIYSSASSIYLAIDRSQLLFYYGLISSCILIGGIIIGITVGKNLIAVGIAISIAFTINFIIVFWMLIHLALKQSFTKFLKSLIFPISISLIMVLPLWFYTKFENDNIIISLFIKFIISILTFTLAIYSKKDNRIFLNKWFKQYIQNSK